MNDEVMRIDRWEPDYQNVCAVCGNIPTVHGVKDGKVIYDGELCGVCTWGEAPMIDPDQWN